jgi:outer membrane protein
MKTLLSKIVPALLLMSVLSSSAPAQSRIATVDLRKLFDGYWKTKQAETTLKERAADMEKQHKGLVDDWNKSKEDYQKLLTSANDLAVSTEERERRKKSAEDKLLEIKQTEQTIEQYRRDSITRIEEQKRRMRENLLKEIRAIIEARAKGAGYGLVFDTTAETPNSTPVLLYTGGENDLTDSVLAQLNAGAQVETSKATEKEDRKR